MGGQHCLYRSPSQQTQSPLSVRIWCFAPELEGTPPPLAATVPRFSSRLASYYERRCDARVRPQQRGCGGTSSLLRPAQRTVAILRQMEGAWGRQEGS